MTTATAIGYPDGEEQRRPWRVQLDNDCRDWFGFGLVTFITKWNALEITFTVPCIVTHITGVLRYGPFLEEYITEERELQHEQVVEMRMRCPDQWFNI